MSEQRRGQKRGQDRATSPGRVLTAEAIEATRGRTVGWLRKQGEKEEDAEDIAGDVVAVLFSKDIGQQLTEATAETLAVGIARRELASLRRKRASAVAGLKRRPKETRFEEDRIKALRSAVREKCLDEFEKRLGFKWDDALQRRAEVSVNSGAGEAENEARGVAAALFHAFSTIVKAGALADQPRRPSPAGEASRFLSWWVPENLPPALVKKLSVLLGHAAIQPGQPWTTPARTARQELVYRWDRIDMLGHQHRFGTVRWLDAREYAIVWLLGGGWPDRLTFPEDGLSAGDVIDGEKRAFAQAIPDHGQREQFPGSLPRGPRSKL